MGTITKPTNSPKNLQKCLFLDILDLPNYSDDYFNSHSTKDSKKVYLGFIRGHRIMLVTPYSELPTGFSKVLLGHGQTLFNLHLHNT